MTNKFASDFVVRTAEEDARDLGIAVGKTIAADIFTRLAIDRASVPEADDLISEVTETESEHYRQFASFELVAKGFNESPDPEAVWEAYEEGVEQGARVYWEAMTLPDLEVCGQGRRADCLAVFRFGSQHCMSSRHTFNGTWKCGLPDEEYETRMIKKTGREA